MKRIIFKYFICAFLVIILIYTFKKYSQDRTSNLVNLIQNQIINSYQSSNKHFKNLNQSTLDYCKNLNEKDLLNLKNNYLKAQNSWHEIEHINFGPIEQNLNYYKIYLWPDKHKMIPKQIKKNLNNEIEKNNFNSQSAAIQGLHTAEQLLYNPTYTKQNKTNSYCGLLTLIGSNLVDITDKTMKQWNKNITFIDQTYKKQREKQQSKFTEIEILYIKSIFQSYVDQLEKITTYKLPPLIASDIKSTEGYLSRRSIDAIKHNLIGFKKISDLNNGLGHYLTIDKSKTYKEWNKKTDHIEQLLIKSDLNYKNIKTAFSNLLDWSSSTLSKSLDIPVGFNASDGD